MKIYPKNWSELQHYKNRSPIWIKLHKKLLDNYEYACLPLASKALAPMMWLLCSEGEDGVITTSHAEIAFRLRVTESDVVVGLKPLIDKGFFVCEQDASDVLADGYQLACLEKRREEIETEKEEEKEKRPRKRVSSSSDLDKPDDVTQQTWEDYLKVRKAKKAGSASQTAIDGIRAEAVIAGMKMEDVLKTCCVRNWVGFEAAWVKTQINGAHKPQSRHSGFGGMDYTEGVSNGKLI